MTPEQLRDEIAKDDATLEEVRVWSVGTDGCGHRLLRWTLAVAGCVGRMR